MIGDQTLFQRADMVEETRRVVQPLIDHPLDVVRSRPISS
jgi:hypothetical protein